MACVVAAVAVGSVALLSPLQVAMAQECDVYPYALPTNVASEVPDLLVVDEIGACTAFDIEMMLATLGPILADDTSVGGFGDPDPIQPIYFVNAN